MIFIGIVETGRAINHLKFSWSWLTLINVNSLAGIVSEIVAFTYSDRQTFGLVETKGKSTSLLMLTKNIYICAFCGVEEGGVVLPVYNSSTLFIKINWNDLKISFDQCWHRTLQSKWGDKPQLRQQQISLDLWQRHLSFQIAPSEACSCVWYATIQLEDQQIFTPEQPLIC